MKKILFMIISAILLCQISFAGAAGIAFPATYDSSGVKGDVNSDGRANNKDVVALFRRVSSGAVGSVDETAADVNKDGKINNKDVVALFRFVSGADPDLPDAPGTVYETKSGTKYTVSGQSAASGGVFTIKDGFVITFEDNAFSSDFNRMSFTYSSGRALQIFVKYVQSGAEKTDDFYLEAGKGAVFNGLISSYLGSGSGKNIKTVTVKTCDGKETDFSLSDLKTERIQVYNNKTYYIQNSRFKVGIQLSWGGGINYIEDKTSSISGLTNLINRADTGRLVQQSYYGTGANGEYTPGSFNGATWSYNPVQGGDKYGNASRLIDVQVNGDSVYIKAQPQDWSLNNQITRSYMENTYTVSGETIRVDNRFVDFSGWTHPYSHQELPAFYVVSYLNRFSWYNGVRSWTDDRVSYRDDLNFWGDSRYAEDCRFRVKNENTETWCSWTSSSSGFGIGLYVPNVDQFYAGKYNYNGSKDPANGATNYVAPLNTLKMVSFDPIEYSYLITTGTVEQIRSTFKKNKDFSKNESLHKNYVSMRVIDTDYTFIDFSVEDNTSVANTPNNTNITYNRTEKALQLRVSKAEDPQVMIDYTGSSDVLYASDYKTLEIVYKIPTSNKLSSYVTDLFLCTGSKMQPDGSERTRASLIKDGQYHTLSVDLSKLSFWSGKINKIRFDYFDACEVYDVIYVKSIRLK
ncbi:MAG: dockerin type I repeat-containing protein [Clostridia bacterium]|nr:dockerin type I repeat-containing protein [Clostridia bacterium]